MKATIVIVAVILAIVLYYWVYKNPSKGNIAIAVVLAIIIYAIAYKMWPTTY